MTTSLAGKIRPSSRLTAFSGGDPSRAIRAAEFTIIGAHLDPSRGKITVTIESLQQRFRVSVSAADALDWPAFRSAALMQSGIVLRSKDLEGRGSWLAILSSALEGKGAECPQ